MESVTKIVINGREYSGVAEMPPEVREQYLQAVAALRGAEGAAGAVAVTGSGAGKVVVKESIVFNGRKYNSLDELPPEIRSLVEHMPRPNPGEPETVLTINQTQTFQGRPIHVGTWSEDDNHKPVEEDPKIAWLLVKILAVVALLLLFLLYLSGTRHGR